MNRNTLNRRRFLKGIGLGTVGGIILGGSNFCVGGRHAGTENQQGRVSQLYKKVTGPARVSLIKGNNRHDIVYQSLKNIENEVLSSIGDKKILIKPNMVLADNPLCATHVDAIRAILDFFIPHYKKQIIIGESSVHKTFDGFEAMEGNGPSWGTPFDSRIAIASLDALAADTLATKIMGFDPKRVLYLSAMTEAGYGQGEIEKINVLGAPFHSYHFFTGGFSRTACNA